MLSSSYFSQGMAVLSVSESPRERLSIDSLATDTLLRVFSFLAVKDRRNLFRVCKSWARQLKSSGELYIELQVDLSGMCDNSSTFDQAFRDLSLLQFSHWSAERVRYTRRLKLTMASELTQQDLCKHALARTFATCQHFRRLERLELIIPGRLWLPCGLGSLSFLRVLSLKAETTRMVLPSWLGQLTSLEELYIQMEITGGVAQEFLPLQLLNMLRLRVLKLDGCYNVHIPLCVGELCDLRQLVVRNCNKLTFKDGSFMRNTFAAMSLHTLTLAKCKLHAVPYQVGAMVNLTELDLTQNNLVTLPATFSIGLKSLRRLVLSKNNLERLPRLLARLPSLASLDLSYNPNLQVHESEQESDDPRHPPDPTRAARPQFSHSLGSLITVLPQLVELDIRQAYKKHWERESLRELGRLQEVMQAPPGHVLRTHCSLKRVFM